MIYTGIGSRQTPTPVLEKMARYGSTLAKMGFILRSGAADGADSAFEDGCDLVSGEKEIFLPWKGFHKHPSTLYNIPEEVYEYAAKVYGSRWKITKQFIRHLMARNIQQVMGETLDTYTDFVICWTPDGCTKKSQRSSKTGGTGQAIACASELNIPVFNLQSEESEQALLNHLRIFYGFVDLD